jgi:hypothetical protein
MTMGYYGSGDGLGMGQMGLTEAEAAALTVPPVMSSGMAVMSVIWSAGHLVSIPLLAYHGFKRNSRSVGWAVVWGLFGPLAWPIVDTIAVAQGYAKPRVQKNRRRRRTSRRRVRRTTRRAR